MHLILLVKNTNKKGGNLGNIKKKRNQRKGKKENSTLGGWPHHGQESDFLVGIPVHGW
jgi:hypothetical protein